MTTRSNSDLTLFDRLSRLTLLQASKRRQSFEQGRPRLKVTLPDETVLDNLARSLASLLKPRL